MHPKLSLAGLLFGAIWSTPAPAHDIYTNLTEDDRAATTMTAGPHISSYRPQALRCWWRGAGCAYPPIALCIAPFTVIMGRRAVDTDADRSIEGKTVQVMVITPSW